MVMNIFSIKCDWSDCNTVAELKKIVALNKTCNKMVMEDINRKADLQISN